MTTTAPDIGVVGLLRWFWRQLTSMRTALVLLLLLGVAAIPGSVFPQRTQNPLAVRDYLAANPALGPILDRLALFDVYGSPWFSAIYLLLFISLIGCVLPRSLEHARALGAKPPATPRNLTRLEEYRSLQVQDSEQSLLAAEVFLRAKRFRIMRYDEGRSLAAEKGYVREAGNLFFHLALIVLLVAIALGASQGARGEAIVSEGETFINAPTGYDNLSLGRLFDAESLTPFAITLRSFEPTFTDDGLPLEYVAYVDVQKSPDAESESTTIRVNHPLTFGSTRVYLIAHGYAPRVTVRGGDGDVVFQGPVALLPQDTNLTSTGAIKVPDAQPEQLGFLASFLPTATFDPARGGFSSHPDAKDPRLLLSAWKGDLGLDSGIPQSVYRLDVSDLDRIGIKALAVGQNWEFADGSITFDGWIRWINVQVVRDPGKTLALWGAIAALGGLLLSLFLRRRRIWVRAGGDHGIELASLSKTQAPGIRDEMDELEAAIDASKRDDEATTEKGSM
jgi:cytochrome c biogenesis protein